jgi:hypothetical protein
MKRPTLNALIDLFGFLSFLILSLTGVILGFILPHRGPGYTGGRGLADGAERAAREFFSLTRQEWSDFHLWVALAFVCFVILHVLLHASFVRAMLLPRALRQ